MHRRSVLSLSALSAVPVLANAAEADPQADWHETVSTKALKLTAETGHGKITLQVALHTLFARTTIASGTLY